MLIKYNTFRDFLLLGTACRDNLGLKNGYVRLIQRSFRIFEGDVSVHACNPNYKLIGNRLRRCNRVGKWSGSLPTCVG